jgi:hypothetical protein
MDYERGLRIAILDDEDSHRRKIHRSVLDALHKIDPQLVDQIDIQCPKSLLEFLQLALKDNGKSQDFLIIDDKYEKAQRQFTLNNATIEMLADLVGENLSYLLDHPYRHKAEYESKYLNGVDIILLLAALEVQSKVILTCDRVIQYSEFEAAHAALADHLLEKKHRISRKVPVPAIILRQPLYDSSSTPAEYSTKILSIPAFIRGEFDRLKFENEAQKTEALQAAMKIPRRKEFKLEYAQGNEFTDAASAVFKVLLPQRAR